ncbi:hypothetical protein GZL_00999 [Streptomyces sp. 769]|nr:hypothetical protein GZL_00999 [Streptomyces sp. 769]
MRERCMSGQRSRSHQTQYRLSSRTVLTCKDSTTYPA